MRTASFRIVMAAFLAGAFAAPPAPIAAFQTSAKPSEGAARRDLSKLRSAEVESAVDAQTIAVMLGGKTVNIALLGVDPPEDEEWAERAALFLAQLLVGERVYIEPAGKAEPPDPAAADGESDKPKKADAGKPRDATGPIADGDSAYLYRVPDGLCVNAELIRQGYARVSARPKFDQLEAFRAFEKRARDAGKGIWADASPKSEKPRTAPQPVAGGKTGPRTNEKPDNAGSTTTVYVTKSGKKYHTQDCQFLTPGASAMSVADATARGLTPCSRCKPR